MLEQLRRNSRSFIIWILFGIIILAFVFTFGSQGGLQFDGCGGAGSSFVMKVEGSEVSVDSFRYGRTTISSGGSDDDETQYVLDKLLEREILAKAAESAGYLTDKDLIVEQYLAKGKFYTLGNLQDLLAYPEQGKTAFMKPMWDNSVTPPERVWTIDDKYLEAIVQSWGLPSIDSFIREQEREILAEMMRGTLRASAVATAEEARARFDHENTTAKIAAVVFRPLSYRGKLALSEQDALTYVATNKEKVEAKYKEDERLYKERKPQIRIRQIFFRKAPPEAKPEPEPAGDTPAAGDPPAEGEKPAASGAPSQPEVPEAPAVDAGRTAADAAYARLQAGEDFAKVAGEVTEDTGSKAKGGDLGWRSVEFPGLGATELATAVKTLEPGSYTEVLAAPTGFFILKVEGKREGDLTFDQVKAEIAEKLMLEDYSKTLASEDAQATLTRVKAGGNLSDLFEAAPQRPSFDPRQLPPEFWQQLSPEQREQLLRGAGAPTGSLTVETGDIPAQSGPATGETPATPAAGAATVTATPAGDPPAGDPAAGAAAEPPAEPERFTGAITSALPITRPADIPMPRLESIGPFRRSSDGDIAGIGQSKEIIDVIFDQLQEGGSSPKVYEVDGNFVVFEVTERKNPDAKEFDDETRQRLMRDISAVRGYGAVQDWVSKRCVALANAGKVGLNHGVLKQLLGEDSKFQYQVCSRLDY